MPEILVFRRLRQEGHKFKVNLNYTRRTGSGGGSKKKRGEGIVGEAGKEEEKGEGEDGGKEREKEVKKGVVSRRRQRGGQREEAERY